jgi:DNA-binding NtrC family response regulator
MIANLIHHDSARRKRPFVAVSCAILAETLIESELFGHERGAFTNAIKDRPGRFELAEGGTLFLDDIDDVPLAMQVKLLRVLQTRTVERVGSVRAIPVDVRVLTGSKRDLRKLVAAGTFREDLYYRLAVIPVVVPPLRERREDIVPLVQHFAALHARRAGVEVRSFSAEAIALMMAYDWPGNVRELGNVVERALTLTASSVISAAEFEPVFALGRPVESAHAERAPDEPGAILAALEASGWNHTKAAESLNIARNTLWRRMKQHGIRRPG